MVPPQPGIFAVGTSAHAYLELDLLIDADPVAAVQVLADLADRETTMGATNLVVGVRPELWARVLTGSCYWVPPTSDLLSFAPTN